MLVSTTIYKSTTMHVCDAADVEHACAVPCLWAEECMHCGIVNGGGDWL